jgi:hypothetical protein
VDLVAFGSLPPSNLPEGGEGAQDDHPQAHAPQNQSSIINFEGMLVLVLVLASPGDAFKHCQCQMQASPCLGECLVRTRQQNFDGLWSTRLIPSSRGGGVSVVTQVLLLNKSIVLSSTSFQATRTAQSSNSKRSWRLPFQLARLGFPA